MAEPARILILTNGPLARNPRVYKEASALGAAGFAVTVLGVRNHAASVALDADLTRGAPFTHRSIDLLGGPGAVLSRLRTKAARAAVARGFAQPIAALGPAHRLLAAARRLPSDLVIGHNEIAHWAALQLHAAGRRVAADIEDWHSEDLLPEAARHRPLALLRTLERRLLQEAAGTSTTSEALADALYIRHGGRRPAVITNAFPLGPARAARHDGGPVRLMWFSQTVGPGRGLEEFVRAWRRMQVPTRLTLVGEPLPGYADALRTLAATAAPRLVFEPPVPPGDLPGRIAAHDIGLALETATPASRNLTITNKILQYLNAGLAVIATPTAGQREVLGRAPAAGMLEDFSDPLAAGRGLDAFVGTAATVAGAQAAARRLAETHYCWEVEAPRLVAHVRGLLAGVSPGTPHRKS